VKHVIGLLKHKFIHFVITRISEARILLDLRFERVRRTRAHLVVPVVSEFSNVKYLVLTLLYFFAEYTRLFRQDLSLGDGQLGPLLAEG